VPFHVIINPQIELLTPPDASFHEGCLSVPGFMAVVPRARKVRVACLDERGKSRTIEATGWYARILQHEIDHLTGRMYIDRMQSETFSTLENYQRHQKK
jgi:peptide deformylase